MDGRRHLRHCTFVAMRDDKRPAGWFAKLEFHRIDDDNRRFLPAKIETETWFTARPGIECPPEDTAAQANSIPSGIAALVKAAPPFFASSVRGGRQTLAFPRTRK
jgi:hypothetical protein